MFWIICIFLFIPYYSWSMDDDSYSSAVFCDSNNEEPLPVSHEAPHSSISANQQTATPVATPRTARSNSIYMAAVQTVQQKLNTPRQEDDGLAELEEGLGVSNSARVEPTTEDQLVEYFYKHLQGKNLPGIGIFDAHDGNKCEDLRNFIGFLKHFAPAKYQRIVRSISRNKSSKYANDNLIAVLTKVVGSIDSLNANTTQVSKEQHDILKSQFEVMEQRFKVEQDSLHLAQQNVKTLTRRYRMNTLWALIGGGVSIVVTNLIQYFISSGGTMDMIQQTQNTTMS